MGGFFCKGYNPGYSLVFQSSGKLKFEIGDGTGYAEGETTSVVNDGKWHHAVIVFDRDSNGTWYIDGGFDSEHDISPKQGSVSNELDLTIGKYYNDFFNGAIDELRVYNRVLSAAEIQESSQKRPDFSSRLLAKVPSGTTQFITTLSWQGGGSVNITIESPSKTYTEDAVPTYQKTVYSTSGGTSSMLNIKRLAVSVTTLSSSENWYIILEFDDVEDYKISVEVQK